MSDRPELSQDTAVNHSQAEIVCLPTCDESGLGDDEKKVEVTEIAPFPPVGLITASSPVANSTDNESELSELTISRLDACEGVVKVEFRSNKDEDDAPKDCDSRNDQSGRSLEIDSEVPPFYEDGAEMMDDSKSVACQTDWSWLAAYRAIEHKLPQQSSSRILKSKSGSKMSKSSDVDIPQTVEMTASSLFDDLENNTRLLDSLKSDPWPDRTDEYGIPIYPASEDEEFLNEDAVPVEGRKEAESKQEVTKEDEGKTNEGVDEDNDEDSDKDEDEDDDDDEEDDDDNEDDEDDDMEESLEQHLDGICRFCGQEKKPLPSPEDQEKKSLDELYCCSEFREYITRILAKTEQSRTEKVEGGQKSRKTGQGRSSRASSSMSGPSGVEGIEWKTKARKKKVRASIGSEGRGRRSKKQKKSLRDSMLDEDQFRSSSRSQQNSRSGGMKNDGSDKPCVVYGRDATTITYQLSSRQCMNWTLGVDGGATSQRRPETAHVVKPVQQQGRSPRLDSQMGLVCQTYEDGSPFLVIFADGSGNVFYPSGQIAVSIIASMDGEYLYIVQDTNGRLLGIYEPSGKTVTYFRNGSLRVCTDETGGLEMDAEGNRRKKWNWDEKGRHVHAPPLYQITCSISSSLTFSISSQEEMMLLFSRANRACRFNVGSSPHGVIKKERPLRLSDNELYIKDIKSRIRDILQKTSTLLRLPGSPRLEGSLSPAGLQKRRRTPSSMTHDQGTSILPNINN